MIKAIKSDNKHATNAFRTLLGKPLQATGALAGGAAGLGVGLVGIAALLFGGTEKYSGVPYSAMAPVVGTGVGIVGGHALGGAVAEGVSLAAGGAVGAVASLVMVIPRGIYYLMRVNSESANEHRDAEIHRADQERYRADQERYRADQERYRAEQQFRRAEQTRRQQSETASAPPGLTELESFLQERQQYNNRKRLYQALFDLDTISETDPRFIETQKDIYPFFQTKIGQKFEEYSHAIICPIELDIPNDPVEVPSDGGSENHMFGYDTLRMASEPQWDRGQYVDSLSRAVGPRSDIHPAYATQSLIERIICRSYEFREEREKAQPNGHANAIKRFNDYQNSRPSNQASFEAILNGKESLNKFLNFFKSHDSFAPTFGEHAEKVRAIITVLQQSVSLPKMPVFVKGVLCDYDARSMRDPSQVSIAYDAQNVIEQVLFAARTLGPEFVNSKNQSNRNNRI